MWKRNFGRKTFVFWRLKRGSCVKGRCSLQKGILHTELSVRIGRAMIQAGNGRIFTVHPCVFFFFVNKVVMEGIFLSALLFYLSL